MVYSATKRLPINGGNMLADLKIHYFIVKTRRTVSSVYGFMLALLAATAFLAFAPSSSLSSPWFTDIFTTSTDSFSSIWFTNTTSSSPEKNASDCYSFPAQNSTNPLPTVQNQTQFSSDSVKPCVLQANQSKVLSDVENCTRGIVNSNKDQAFKPNQTTISANQIANSSSTQAPTSSASPVAANQVEAGNSSSNSALLLLPANQNASTPANSVSSSKQAANATASNYTASLATEQSNGSKQSNRTESVPSGEQGLESLVSNLVNCDLFDGEWVRDDSYPLYNPASCSSVDEQFNCILNGRPDEDYLKYKWKPKGCSIPRLNPAHMLNMLRGKRLAFVGDSLNRNMWESLVCTLKGSVKDQSKVYEARARRISKGESFRSFIFEDYGCSVEFFASPFLVQQWETPAENGTKKETLRLDLLGISSDQYKDADIIVFNTGHWWNHEKTSKGKNYFQEGNHIYEELDILEAFGKALTTWARWVDRNINRTKTFVLFRGYSQTHYSGGQWNSGGSCNSEVEPIKNGTYLREYPPKMLVLEKILRKMKTHVTYQNITQMTDYRKDGHPSIYRNQNITKESPLPIQDCSHWCLPGVPDAWNEILYAELLLNDYRKRLVQKRRR